MNAVVQFLCIVLALSETGVVGYKYLHLYKVLTQPPVYGSRPTVVSEEQTAAYLKNTCGCALYVFVEKIPGVETLLNQHFDAAPVKGFKNRLDRHLDIVLRQLETLLKEKDK